MITNKEASGFPVATPRQFISHRGVHLGSRISGENSLESIALAKRAAFSCVEFDVGLSRDEQLFVMHDKTLNRTVLRSDGTALSAPLALSSQTGRELKNDFKLRAEEPRQQTAIPTYEEFLMECKRLRILPFIELKLHDMPDELYLEVVGKADEYMGRGNYVITSNNQANEKIRSLGIVHAPVMAILYQTSFEKIQELRNAIMAISASRFEEPEFAEHVKKCNQLGIATESHSDNFERYRMIARYGIDYVSTDKIAPDLGAAPLVLQVSSETGFDAYYHNGKSLQGILRLEKMQYLSLLHKEALYFGAIFLELEYKGKAKVKFMDQDFELNSSEVISVNYQLMIYNSETEFEITATEAFEIHQLIIKVARY